MKKPLFVVLLLTAFSLSYAQTDNPIHWKTHAKKLDGNTYELHFTATIDQPYHIYAKANDKGLVLPTKIYFLKNPQFTLQDTVHENGVLQSQKEKITGEMINYYLGRVDFVQVIKLKSKGKIHVRGYVDYMACTDEHCLPEAKQVFNITVGL